MSSIKLCYKTYDVKMSLSAIKQFNSATGLDIYASLLDLIVVMTDWQKSNTGVHDLCRNLYKSCDFITASKLFHAMIVKEGSRIDMEEIQDAMFRVGILPTEIDNDMGEPWCMVLVEMAFAVVKDFEDMSKGKKKEDI